MADILHDKPLSDYINSVQVRHLLVYLLVSLVPPGFVTTYGSISRVSGIAPRVVGRILAANPYPIIIPCHRVVRGDRSLGGYSMGGPRVKRMILEVEGVEFVSKGRVLEEHVVYLEELI